MEDVSSQIGSFEFDGIWSYACVPWKLLLFSGRHAALAGETEVGLLHHQGWGGLAAWEYAVRWIKQLCVAHVTLNHSHKP